MKALSDLEKLKIRQSFAAASLSYDRGAELQRRVAQSLLRKVEFSAKAETVVDVGCGTGYFTRHALAQLEGGKMLAMDIALPMLEVARQNDTDRNVGYFCADAEKLPLTVASVDMIISNLALQWCRFLPSLFEDFHRSLKASGKLVFSTFGPATLQELKAAWAAVDDYSHVNEFYSLSQLTEFIRMAGFHLVAAESVNQHIIYPSVMALMNELKGIGAHNVTVGRNKQLTTRSQLQKMIAAYPAGDSGRIKASYEIIYVTAEKT